MRGRFHSRTRTPCKLRRGNVGEREAQHTISNSIIMPVLPVPLANLAPTLGAAAAAASLLVLAATSVDAAGSTTLQFVRLQTYGAADTGCTGGLLADSTSLIADGACQALSSANSSFVATCGSGPTSGASYQYWNSSLTCNGPPTLNLAAGVCFPLATLFPVAGNVVLSCVDPAHVVEETQYATATCAGNPTSVGTYADGHCDALQLQDGLSSADLAGLTPYTHSRRRALLQPITAGTPVSSPASSGSPEVVSFKQTTRMYTVINTTAVSYSVTYPNCTVEQVSEVIALDTTGKACVVASPTTSFTVQVYTPSPTPGNGNGAPTGGAGSALSPSSLLATACATLAVYVAAAAF